MIFFFLFKAHWILQFLLRIVLVRSLIATPNSQNTRQKEQEISREQANRIATWNVNSVFEPGLTVFPELSLLLWELIEHAEDAYYHYLLNRSYCWGFLYLIILDSFPKLICHNIKKWVLWILLAWSFLESQQKSEHCCLMITYDNSQYLFRVQFLLLPFAGQSLSFGLNPLPCHSLTWKEMLGKAQN